MLKFGILDIKDDLTINILHKKKEKKSKTPSNGNVCPLIMQTKVFCSQRVSAIWNFRNQEENNISKEKLLTRENQSNYKTLERFVRWY